MKLKTQLAFFIGLSMIVFLSACSEEGNPISDVQKIAALKDVTLAYDSMSYELKLPEGALSGKSFEELMVENAARYGNLENYTISFFCNMTADNTKPDAKDAKFDGMTIDFVMDTITSSPISTVNNGFEVAPAEKLPVSAEGTINLLTHKMTGIYIFQQIVDGLDLATTLSPKLNYQIGISEGVFDLPGSSQNIPTRASDETKAFLQGLLNSDVLNTEISKEE